MLIFKPLEYGRDLIVPVILDGVEQSGILEVVKSNGLSLTSLIFDKRRE